MTSLKDLLYKALLTDYELSALYLLGRNVQWSRRRSSDVITPGRVKSTVAGTVEVRCLDRIGTFRFPERNASKVSAHTDQSKDPVLFEDLMVCFTELVL